MEPRETGPSVGIFVDYESPLARKVAGKVWSGLSRAALDAGNTKTSALWESLREPRNENISEGPAAYIFAIGQDMPEAIDCIQPVGEVDAHRLYGIVVAVPEQRSPLAGPLLYQGVERITDSGVKSGAVEPALLHDHDAECERYARRLLERLPVP